MSVTILRIMNAHTEPHLVSSDTSVLVFVNRVAGRGRVQAYLHRLRDLFESVHISAKFLETGSASELESASREALVRGHRLFLAMGGDGTFQALVNGAFNSDAIVGILPTGGGNDFAAALGLPGDLIGAAERLLKGKPRSVDLVRVRTADGGARLFAAGGGVGLDAEAALLAAGAYRHLPGRFRYVASALRAWSEHQPLQVRLEFPGTEIHPVEATCLLTGVLNTPAYGGGIRLAPDALIDDALLHVALVEDLNVLQVLKLLPRLMRSGELRTSRIRRWKAQSVKISTDRPCLFHGDGEILGPTPVEIEVVPKAVRVLAPLAES
jgi:diacylglycerol kinase (ATP)